MPGEISPLLTSLTQANLKEHYGAATRGLRQSMSHNPELPYVPRPSYFQPDPLVVGSPQEARNAKALLDLDPGTKERVSGITYGPTQATMEEMAISKLPIDKFAGTSLRGIFDLENRAIGVNPGMNENQTLKTTAHEIGHGAGLRETGAQKAGDMIFPDPPADDASMNRQIDAMIEALKKAGIAIK